MSCISYSRFNVIDLKDIKNSYHENIILEKLNIKKYLKKDSIILYNYEEIMKIFNKIHIFQTFLYSFKELNKRPLKIFFICDNLPEIEDIYNKNYSCIYLEDDCSLLYIDDPRIKEFESWLEKIVYYRTIFGTDYFYKNNVYNFSNYNFIDYKNIKNHIKRYVQSLKIKDGQYFYSKIIIENTDKILYIKYRDAIEIIKKIVLYFIDEYEELFIKDMTVNTELYSHLYNKIFNQPFIIEDICVL
jgi:hypothetical protein